MPRLKRSGPVKRGRPTKFGRAAELIALTLPSDVLDWLRDINEDPAWAIVALFERATKRRRQPDVPPPKAELVQVGRRRALIVVDQKSFNGLRGVSLVPLAVGRSFLALENGSGLADLEIAVLDRLDERSLAEGERSALAELRNQLRAWRRDRTLSFHVRSIIVVERRGKSSKRVTRDGRR